MLLQSMFSALTFLNYGYDDDFVDRMSYFYSSSFLIMMAVLVSFKQFGGKPLECFVPHHFSSSWEKYTEMYCWAQNTYYLQIHERIPFDLNSRRQREISYYQWVPFFLLCEAGFFYIPCLIWRLLNGMSGIRLLDIMTLTKERSNIDPEYRAKTIAALSRHIENVLKYQHGSSSANHYTMHRILKCLNVRYYESYVSTLYLIAKVMYTINVVGNLILMNKFLETDTYGIYGWTIAWSLLNGRDWQDSGNFPRVTLCDFDIRVLGNIQRYTVQCVLVINIFTEKIFILLWMWYSVLAVFSIFSCLYWCSISVFRNDRKRFIVRHLELTEQFTASRHPSKVDTFLDQYIKVDGVFVLRMVSLHGGVMYCTELVQALWERFLVAQEDIDARTMSIIGLEPGHRINSLTSISHGPRPNIRKASGASSAYKKSLTQAEIALTKSQAASKKKTVLGRLFSKKRRAPLDVTIESSDIEGQQVRGDSALAGTSGDS